MPTKRRNHSDKFKFNVALEAAAGFKTISQIASEHNLHPNQVTSWKKKLMENGSSVFTNKITWQAQAQVAQEAELYEQIGRLKMELEWLKKKATPFR